LTCGFVYVIIEFDKVLEFNLSQEENTAPDGAVYSPPVWTEEQWNLGIATPVLLVKTPDYEGPDRRQTFLPLGDMPDRRKVKE